ncbi:cytochrome P450 [Actinopolyspora biskrensis]|uniref:Cytochrome P450 n=1 Tax=Actinopolyspora biskrensis TaxID=1470178 RepID=A0A852YUL1_9ACTN|nr:cytochrome P450 [Actinopolyspora biskrensis]NYH77422.1 cytochrome P450 [Actinopolyspora biskrensis]
MVVAYPFNKTGTLDLDEAYYEAQKQPGLVRVQMPYGEPAWLVTRYEDARFVLGDKRFSNAETANHDAPRIRAEMEPGGINSMDPPDHTRLRTLAAKAFTKRRAEELRPRVREIATGLVNDMVTAGPPVDLVDCFALSLPISVICELMGVPLEDRPKFRVWTDGALSTSRLPRGELMANWEDLRGYMRDLVIDHRTAPRDDLITALIEARDEQDRLSEDELVELCVTLLIAGHETTSSQIPNFVLTLLDHPEVMAQLRSDPTLIPGAVEELLRFVPMAIAAMFPRYAKEDVQVGTTLVRGGEPVLVAIDAANHDSLRFPDPDTLKVDAPPNQHLGFGHGMHHCAGAALARVELQEALRALLLGLPRLHLADDVEWKKEMMIRSPQTMPVGW